jgi:hypothetical protein
VSSGVIRGHAVATAMVDAVAFLLPAGPRCASLATKGEFWVVMRCDFVID